MNCTGEWEYCKALESVITVLVKAKEKGWGRWTLGIHEQEPKYMKLEIADKSGNNHWFKVGLDGNLVPLPVQMTCF